MKILLASPRGFCAGVNMAIESFDLTLREFGAPVYVYHEIVHNKYVVESFKEKGAVFVDGFFAASPTPLVQEFVERYQARYHEMPDLLAAQGYDTIWLLAQTLLEGAETRTRVRDKLLSVQNLAGVSGMISMRPSGDAGKMLYLLSVQNGQIMQLN